MELLTYFIVTIVLAIIFFPGLRRYDVPNTTNRMMNRFAYDSRSFFEREQLTNELGLRRMLSGSLFRVCWLLVGWGGTGIFLFIGDNKIQGFLTAIAFAFPWGFGLAVAVYNIRKWLNKKY